MPKYLTEGEAAVIRPIILARTALNETLAELSRLGNAGNGHRSLKDEIDHAIDVNLSKRATDSLRAACAAQTLTMVVSDPRAGLLHALPAEYFDRPNADLEFNRGLFGAYELSDQVSVDPLYKLVRRYSGWVHGFIEAEFRTWLKTPEIGGSVGGRMRPIFDIARDKNDGAAERSWPGRGSRVHARQAIPDIGERPFPDWENPARDQPVRLLDAIKLWSPQFGRRLDELAGSEYWKWRSADEIRQAAQERQRARIRYDHPTSVAIFDRKGGAEITAGGMADADEAADAEIPDSLRNDLARLLRDWGRWDDKDRVVNATQLAGRLGIEKTRRGQPYRLEYAPPALPGDLRADYRPVGRARHDALGPYDLDLRNSTIRDPGGNWLPARIFAKTTAEAGRTREISAANTPQSAERRAPDPEPTYSLAVLARSWAEMTGELWESVLYRLGDWAITDAFPDDAFLSANAGDTTFHKRVIFDRVRWHRELVNKIRRVQDPNEIARLQQFADIHLRAAEIAVLRRDVVAEACRAMDVAPPPILGLVVGVSAKHRVPPECPPDPPIGVYAREAERDQAWRHRGEVMAPDDADKYTLLWDAAAEMSRNNERGVEWNWLRLMDAFWRGDLARSGLVHFYPTGTPGREFVTHDRESLAGLLLGWRPEEDETREPAQSIDTFRHWTVADYRRQPIQFGDYFRADPEGHLGLAALTRDLDRWRERPAHIVVAPTAIATEPVLPSRQEVTKRGRGRPPRKRDAVEQAMRAKYGDRLADLSASTEDTLSVEFKVSRTTVRNARGRILT